ncbi:MAG TPA: hypothetical protein VMX17_11430 [Candidatus Glassbacteria bacterium]|nr:hypothetical protein [Candidatus Glassbacteria bacterium]
MDDDTWEKDLPRIDDIEDIVRGEDYENYEGYSREKPTRRRQRDDISERELDELADDDIQLMHKRWKNRRRMAWLSLISMILLTFLILFTNIVSVERLSVLGNVITWFYFSCASIIGMYMGATTWAAVKGR